MFASNHPEWVEFEQRVQTHIDKLVGELENVTLDLDHTNFTRGKIAAYRSILAEGRTPAPPPSVEPRLRTY